MNRTLVGLLILAIVAGIAVASTFFDLSSLTRQIERRDPVTVSIFFGGEKSALLKNPAIEEIIERDYRITLNATKAGSIEMVTTLDTTGKDCVWPSNMVAVELARASGKPVIGDQTIFNSPIVFYAWSEVTEALTAKGLVTARNDGTYSADINGIGTLIADGARWKEDLGVNIYGTFKVFSTHPAKSNSGNIWSALLATSLNGGDVPTEEDMATLLPQIETYFDAMGHMEASSGDIFDNFLKQGVGARPIIVGYENQLVEFLRENAQYTDLISSKINTIYPEPTIFASHPLIALTPACKRLEEALMDPALQEIAWADHGFRTGLLGVQNDVAKLENVTLPEQVSLVVPMPAAKVAEEIIEIVR